MILNRLTSEAESAAARYSLLTEAWRGLYHNAINSSKFGSAELLARTVSEAYAIADTFITEERQTAERLIEEIALEARQTTLREIASNDADDLSDRVLEHLSATENYILDELIAQVHRDIAQLRSTLQKVTLEVSIASRARGISERIALIEYRIGNQADMQFMFHDRSSRKWASNKFVRAIWRHTLLAVYNELVLFTLSDHGLARAQIYHVDEKAEVHGKTIAMGSNSYFPTYSEIRHEIFHPNANAYLKMERADVPA